MHIKSIPCNTCEALSRINLELQKKLIDYIFKAKAFSRYKTSNAPEDEPQKLDQKRSFLHMNHKIHQKKMENIASLRLKMLKKETCTFQNQLVKNKLELRHFPEPQFQINFKIDQQKNMKLQCTTTQTLISLLTYKKHQFSSV